MSYIFSYGGQKRDLEQVLQIIAAGTIKPQVSVKRLKDFPSVLRDLENGKVDGRIALLPDEQS